MTMRQKICLKQLERVTLGTGENETRRCWTLKDEDDNSFVTPLRFSTKLQRSHIGVRLRTSKRQNYALSRRYIDL